MTSSVSLFASLIDSALDISSSLINVIALRYSLVPADQNHRFGHYKFQDIAVFGQGMFFTASSLFIVYEALSKLGNKVEVYNEGTGITTIFLSMIATMILLRYQTFVIARTGSSLIKTDKLHYLTDLFTNFTVIISIYLSKTIWFIDSLFAILIAIYLLYGAYEVIKESLKNLSDEEFSDKDKNKILSILKKHKKQNLIIAIHDLKTRTAADKRFIQFHLELEGSLTLFKCHEITERIEKEILTIFPECEVIIHQDPSGIEEEKPYRDELDVSK